MTGLRPITHEAPPLEGRAIVVNRTLGLVYAGDDGQHFMRYGSFGVRIGAGSGLRVAGGDADRRAYRAVSC